MSNKKDTGVITYKDLSLSIAQVDTFQKLELVQKKGKHTKLELEATLSGNLKEMEFYKIQDTVTVFYEQKGKTKILFSGSIDKISMEKDGGKRKIIVTAFDHTWKMDQTKRKRLFQNPQMKIKEVIEEVMSSYKNSDYLFHIENKAIGQLFIQYEETDWEFLKRFLSQYYETPYPEITHQAEKIQIGLQTKPASWNFDSLPYEMIQDFETYDKMKKNGLNQLTLAKNIGYKVVSYDLAEIGDQITYRGNPWYISSVKRELKNGLLTNTYELHQKERMKTIPYYNKKIAGVSIDGTVADVKRNKVQVQMEIDTGNGGDSNYWFPFSTVASSSDGSGWYCMPEKGESVRVYFPTRNEKEGYVITSIKAHEPQSSSSSGGSSGSSGGASTGSVDPMGDPSVRNIQTEQNNQVQFKEDGVYIMAGAGNGSIILKNDGNVVLDALQDIKISAGEMLTIIAKNELNLKSQTKIQVISDSGADMEVKQGEIQLHGMMIVEN
ncbi:MAG TPA: hypothetical protein IAC14_01670 [Candidatus Scybalomonas excrementigallinarum]|nr:hypothetical protein [Candidatus Scybalomonas excrementigallinarum]